MIHAISNAITVETFQNLTTIPFDLTFSLRFPAELRLIPPGMPIERYNWFTTQLFPTFQEYGPRNYNDTDGGLPPGYCLEGFLPVQSAISKAFIHGKMNGDEEEAFLEKIYLQRFPHPPFVADQLLKGLEMVLPLIILLSFLSSVVNIVRVWLSTLKRDFNYSLRILFKHVNYEKEQKLKEAMMTMGIPNNLHWAAFFVKNLQLMTVSVALLTMLLKVRPHSP